MDYLSFIEGQFTLNASNLITAYFSDGSSKAVDLSSFGNILNYEELCYRVANDINRDNNFDIFRLVGFSYYSGGEGYFVPSNREDFFMFSAYATADMQVTAVTCIDSEGFYLDIDDYSGIENYAQYDALVPFTTGTYGEFSVNIYPSESSVIFDYTNLYYVNSGYTTYRTDVVTARGENVSFYKVYFHIEDLYTDDLIVQYGSPIQSLLDDEYQRGLSAGYAGGYVQGHQDGYITGFNSNGGTPETATAFSYIGNAFEVVTNVMSLEILPHVTLGLAFSIPLVFTLIMVMFKLIRK